MSRLHVEVDLTFDGPAGPGRIVTREGALVVRVPGWGALLRLTLHAWRATPASASPLRTARHLSRLLGHPVYLSAGWGPRIRIAGPR